ncbi:hypothetical protein IV01_17820 [Pseudomonas syringae]|uniref:Uncharacterized protein n=1 Tax=Pseudomonas syringae TaxID=317 RepID=A0A085VEW0_PSESX|nr:hypothetical protein IV01_17820 [Pseudomonas syringae]
MAAVGARLPAMNDDAACLTHRSACIAGKHRSHRHANPGANLLAMNDDAVCLTHRSACIAGKPSSHRSDLDIGTMTWDRL